MSPLIVVTSTMEFLELQKRELYSFCQINMNMNQANAADAKSRAAD